MLSKNDLFRLVQSLNNDELRYVSRSLTQHKRSADTISARLLKAIRGMTSLDDRLLMKKIPSISSQALLSKYKQRLFDQIMHALRDFHAKHNIRQRMAAMIAETTMLYERGLFDLSMKKLLETAKMLRRYEFFGMLYDLLLLRRKILIESESDGYRDLMLQVDEELVKVTVILRANSNMLSVYNRLSLINREKFNSSEGFTIEDIMKEGLNDAESKLCFRTRQIYLGGTALYHDFKNDSQQLYQVYKELTELWDTHKHMIEVEQDRYKEHLANYLGICHRLGKYEVFPELMKKLLALTAKTEKGKALDFEHIRFHQLLWYINTLQLDEAEKLVATIEKGFEDYIGLLRQGRMLAFEYNIVQLYMLKGKWDKANEWIDKILTSKFDVRKDIQLFSRILKVIVHFELGNYDLIESLTLSAKRYLANYRGEASVEAEVLKHLKSLAFLGKERVTIKALHEFLSAEGAKNFFGKADLHLWIRGKMERKKMAQLVKEELQTS